MYEYYFTVEVKTKDFAETGVAGEGERRRAGGEGQDR